MTHSYRCQCRCEKAEFEIHGEPIMIATCHCESCRKAAERLERLSPPALTRNAESGTEYALVRKDRSHGLPRSEAATDCGGSVSTTPKRVPVVNVNTGRTTQVDVEKYQAMRKAMLECLPTSAEGLTVAELKALVSPRLPQTLFPGGEKAGWWLKCVQLDLEAKELIRRVAGSKPLRLRRVPKSR